MVIELLNTLNSSLTLSANVLLMSYLILLGFTFLFFFLVRRIWLAVFLADALWVTFATINHTKIYFRGDPFFSGDVLLAGEAVTSLNELNFQVSPRMLAAILLFSITLLLCRTAQWKPRRSWRLPVAAAGTAAILALFVCVVVCNEHVMQDVFHVNRYTWNQMTNYKKNGFVLSFTGSLANLTIDTPAYNRGALEDLYLAS